MDTKKLRQKILDLAIHGKLVSQDPNDEPASVLLDRIRAEKERLIAEGKIKRSKKSATSDTSHYENVPFEVPEGWCWRTLGDIGTWQAGGTPSRMHKEYYGGNIPWLKTGDLNDGIITSIPEYITEEGLNNSSAKLNPKGSVLIAMYGATIGKIGILGMPATTNQACCACINYEGIIQKYLFYFLLSHKEEFIALGGGGAQPNISKDIIVKTLIPIPPIKEQERIVSQIDNLLNILETLDTNKYALETSISQAKSKILDLAIHGKIVPQDASDEPASELLKRINPKAVASCDNPHYEQVPFEIPANWAWIRIDEINKFKSKTVNPLSYPTSQFELYSVPTFETGEPEFPYGKDVASSKVEVEEGDVLLCKINPHLNRVWVVRRIMAQLKSLASSEWIVIRTDEIMPEYLALTMQSPYFRELMMSNVSGVGGSLMRAQPTFVKQYMIPIPPIREQERIIEKVAQFNLYIDTIASTLP